MTELEHALLALGAELDVPAAPDLAAAVAARLRPRRRLRPLVVALALAALAVAIAFAVPQARTAILRFFHIRGATVERVDTLPTAQERSFARDLGEPMSPARAQQLVAFRIRLPRSIHRVYARDGFVFALVRAHGKPVLLTEFYSAAGSPILKKIAGSQTSVEYLSVGRDPGIWIEGGEHILVEANRLPVAIRGNVLLWQHGTATLRLEGRIGRAEALALARTLSVR
jgi:hypothetical protein